MAGRPCTVCLVCVRPGSTGPAGYLPTGVVSRWQDTGRVRAELWERHESAHVGAGGDPGTEAGPDIVLPPDGACAATVREIATAQERNT